MKRSRTRQTVYEQVHRRVLADARFLLRHQRWHSAAYLGGYVLECLLKVAVCVYLNVRELPKEYEVHDLPFLLDRAGLAEELRGDTSVHHKFDVVHLTWRTDLRYSGKMVAAEEARRFFRALEEVLKWLNERISKRRWPI
jgi:HEPN domain-containing protein